jgi:alpha-tubulin suppressor-like RCC1 family protein
MAGNGTAGSTAQTRPIQVPVPGGRKVRQVVSGNELIVLCTDGTVWTCGGYGASAADLGYAISGTSYQSLVQLSSLSGINQIAGGGIFNYALKSDGTLYGWGYYGYYMGGTGGAGNNIPLTTPTDLTTRLNLRKPIKTIVTNMVSTYAILTDGSLWAWGDNAQGTMGNGKELNYAATTYPYAWDFYPAELLQQTPVQVTTRTDFVAVFATQPFVFYAYAETADGTLYSWGRNKGGVLGNGKVGCSSIASTYPNSWDVPLATVVTPLAISTVTMVPSPYCLANPTTAPCNTCALVNTTLSSDTTASERVTPEAVTAKDLNPNTGSIEQLLVYPTVTNDNINLRIVSDTNGTVQASIYDMNGKRMQTEQINKQDTQLNTSFNVGRLPSGMYIVQVLIGDRKRMMSKFVKQ